MLSLDIFNVSIFRRRQSISPPAAMPLSFYRTRRYMDDEYRMLRYILIIYYFLPPPRWPLAYHYFDDDIDNRYFRFWLFSIDCDVTSLIFNKMIPLAMLSAHFAWLFTIAFTFRAIISSFYRFLARLLHAGRLGIGFIKHWRDYEIFKQGLMTIDFRRSLRVTKRTARMHYLPPPRYFHARHYHDAAFLFIACRDDVSKALSQEMIISRS